MSQENRTVSSGLSMGAAFSLMLSWTTWHSFWWAILHGVLSWFYVGYFFLYADHDTTYHTPDPEPTTLESTR